MQLCLLRQPLQVPGRRGWDGSACVRLPSLILEPTEATPDLTSCQDLKPYGLRLPASLLGSPVRVYGSRGAGARVSRGPCRDPRPRPARPRGPARAETAANPTGL